MGRIRVSANARLIDPKSGNLTKEGQDLFNFLADAVNGAGDVIVSSGEQTLTGKRIDGDDNTLVNIETASLKKTSGGSDTVATGNGVSATLAVWGDDGDLETGPFLSLLITTTVGDGRYLMLEGLNAMRAPAVLVAYTVAGVPAAADYTGGTIFVSNESGGAVLAFSDGTNWRRVTDRAIIS